MAPIDVDDQVLVDVSRLYATAQSASAATVEALATSLNANAGCAGSDTAGATWADGYNEAAVTALSASADVVNSFGKLHDLLAYTAVNHANTETENTTAPGVLLEPPTRLRSVQSRSVASASGGDSDPPFGWDLITGWLQGHLWPNGDPDRLRVLARSWEDAASGLRAAVDGTGPGFPMVEDLRSGEIAQILAQMDLVFSTTDEVAAQFDAIAASCREWAGQIEDAHDKIFDILAVAAGAGVFAGILAGILTMGTGSAAAVGAAASGAGAAIVSVLVTLDAAAITLVGTVTAAGVVAGGVVTELQPLLAAEPTIFNADTGGNRPGDHNYQTPPDSLQAFPGATRQRPIGPRFRKSWKDRDGNTYEWDYQHGTVEKYGKNGKHLGEYDPVSGNQTKPADPTRRSGR